MIFDAHVHLQNFDGFPLFEGIDGYAAVSSCSTIEEFLALEKLCGKLEEGKISSGAKKTRIYRSFGIHPWSINEEYFSFLEELLERKKMDFAGECGIDLFTAELKADLRRQTECFSRQLELCENYGVPVVIHSRKSTEIMLRFSGMLKKVPKAVFHSWPGTHAESEALLRRGVNAFFSFGTNLLCGKKSALECVRKLPLERIVFETDFPYQNAKSESYLERLLSVYKIAGEIRGFDFLKENPGAAALLS